MPSNDSAPITIDSEVRFAVIGPGQPYPYVILASDERYSDLVGYFSLRQLGFEKLLDTESSSSSFDLASLFFSPSKEKRAAISSVDLWDKGSKDREQMFSLVVDSPIFDVKRSKVDPEILERIKDQVRNVVVAYEKADIEKIRYNGQMLSTILALISAQLERRKTRRRYLYQIFIAFMFIYVVVAFGAIFAKLTFK